MNILTASSHASLYPNVFYCFTIPHTFTPDWWPCGNKKMLIAVFRHSVMLPYFILLHHNYYSYNSYLNYYCTITLYSLQVTSCTTSFNNITLYILFYIGLREKKERLFPYTALTKWFLGVFAKMRKATISFVMSTRPSGRPYVRMEQLDSHWTDFHEIWYLSIFRESVEKIKICQE
jgi:hypothetical protein